MELRHVVIACLLLEYLIEGILPTVGLSNKEIAKVTKAIMILITRFMLFYSCKEILSIAIQVLNEHEQLKRDIRMYRKKRKRRKRKP